MELRLGQSRKAHLCCRVAQTGDDDFEGDDGEAAVLRANALGDDEGDDAESEKGSTRRVCPSRCCRGRGSERWTCRRRFIRLLSTTVDTLGTESSCGAREIDSI
jgi:hypothetical protein